MKTHTQLLICDDRGNLLFRVSINDEENKIYITDPNMFNKNEDEIGSSIGIYRKDLKVFCQKICEWEENQAKSIVRKEVDIFMIREESALG
jgi:hypothetical protein